MAIKHKIVINVSDPNGRKANVLRGADVKLPARLLRFLFGDFTQVYLLSPGQTVESVDIREVEEGGKAHGYIWTPDTLELICNLTCRKSRSARSV